MIYDQALEQDDYDRTINYLVKTAIVFVCVALGFLLGKSAALSEHSLVQCQEDEVWYPANYTGSEAPEDLVCIHMEEIGR